MDFDLMQKGDVIRGRFGRHSSGFSPDWKPWADHTITHIQHDRKNNVVIVEIDGVEFSPKDDYESESGGVHTLNAEKVIFEFTA